MSTESAEKVNNDLVWGLEGINERKRAIDFVMKFENKLCIFSGSVEQIYTNYNLYFPESQNHNMVVIPNQYAYHDTFNHVNDEAIVDTHFDIIPGEMIGKTGLYMRVPYKEGGKINVRPIPFRFAIERMLVAQNAANPFVPVLVKGNLREFELTNPYLHLHRIQIDKLDRLSQFEQDDIKRVVWDKLKSLAEEH
jgi:hypothetical protein